MEQVIEIASSKSVRFERRHGRLRRNVWFSAQAHEVGLCHLKGQRAFFITLTYRDGDDWRPKHISEAIERVRKWAKRAGAKLRYTWVAEMQTRGAIHYHAIVWLPKHLSMPKWDKRGWWPHGFTNVQRAKAATAYLMKYASKYSEFHDFPRGARINGCGGHDSQTRAIRSWRNLPQWVQQLHGVGEVKRTVSGYLVPETGEILESPWVVLRGGGRLFLRAVGPLPERWADGAYCSVSF